MAAQFALWPFRLLHVDAPGAQEDGGGMLRARSARVLRELSAAQALGPQGEAVERMTERALALEAAEAGAFLAQVSRAPDELLGPLRATTDYLLAISNRLSLGAVCIPVTAHVLHLLSGSGVGGLDAEAAAELVTDALAATLARDLLPPEQYGLLMQPWLRVFGQTEAASRLCA